MWSRIFDVLLLCLTFTFTTSDVLGRFHYLRHQERNQPTELRQSSPSFDELNQRKEGNARTERCPSAKDIAPCRCEDSVFLNLDCSNALNISEITEVFQKDFPTKEFDDFTIFYTTSLTHLNFTTNGISFRAFIFTGHSIESIAKEVFHDSSQRVTHIEIIDTKITNEGFPFEALSDYPKLLAFEMLNSRVSSMPSIESQSMDILMLGDNQISSLEQGMLEGTPNLSVFVLFFNRLTELHTAAVPYGHHTLTLDFSENQIRNIAPGAFQDRTSTGSGKIKLIHLRENFLTELTANTIPVTSDSSLIDLALNNIGTIAPEAFYVQSEPGLSSLDLILTGNALTTIDEAVFGPIMPFVRALYLQENPLECDCSISWLVLSPFLSKVSESTTCSDGTPVYQLDPLFFFGNCSLGIPESKPLDGVI